ncbi:MAG: hypothetical protein H7249_19205 [Chitinophagaceae bacterium]|nr:hypothetical protein [Oligoflexus sp.]
MKLLSVCVAAALLSSNVFAQAKPSDLAPTPVTTQAQKTSNTNNPTVAEKAKADVKTAAKKVKAKSKKVALNNKKNLKRTTASARKSRHTASAKTSKSSVIR